MVNPVIPFKVDCLALVEDRGRDLAAMIFRSLLRQDRFGACMSLKALANFSSPVSFKPSSQLTGKLNKLTQRCLRIKN